MKTIGEYINKDLFFELNPKQAHVLMSDPVTISLKHARREAEKKFREALNYFNENPKSERRCRDLNIAYEELCMASYIEDEHLYKLSHKLCQEEE